MSYKRPTENKLHSHWDPDKAGGGYGISIYRFAETLGRLLDPYTSDHNSMTKDNHITFKLHWPLCYYWRVDP